MFTTRWRLFRVGRIAISVDASWLIILALATLSLANLSRQLVPGLTPASYWVMGLVTALSFFACIVLHELGHALTAQRLGIPIRGITLFLFGGVAELEGEPPSAGKEFAMAIAGPVVSAVLAGALGLGYLLGALSGWPAPVVAVFWVLALINLVVLGFNMIPAFPLDGGRVLRSALWAYTGSVRKATYWASLMGQAFSWVLFAWALWDFARGYWAGGLWTGLIGLFLNNAAKTGYQQVLIRQALEGEPVSRFMNPDPVTVPPALDLRTWLDEYVYRYHHKTFPVVADGRLLGVIGTRMLARFPREEWGRVSVGEAMRADLDAVTVPPQTDAMKALERMQRTGSSRLLVTEGDRLVGIISLKDLLRFLHLKLELEGPEERPPDQPPHLRDARRDQGARV
jgi:Zn-dependent protease/CBS domain-containing protein